MMVVLGMIVVDKHAHTTSLGILSSLRIYVYTISIDPLAQE